MPKVITITEHEGEERGPSGFKGYDVQIGDKIADGLTWDEMLGQIARATMGLPLFAMRTREEIIIRRYKNTWPDESPCDAWPYYETGYGEIPF